MGFGSSTGSGGSLVYGSPVDVGTANVPGGSTAVARADHVHDLNELTLRTVASELTAAFSVNSQKVSSLAAGTVNTDAVNKLQMDNAAAATLASAQSYADAIAAGLDPKASVRAATTASITLSGAQTIDGVSCIAGDRVLVKDQSAATNGIYVVAAGAWSRSTDADTSAEVTAGMYCFVTEGSANGSKGFVLVTPDPIVLGTTVLSFSQFTGVSVAALPLSNLSLTAGDQSTDQTAFIKMGAATFDVADFPASIAGLNRQVRFRATYNSSVDPTVSEIRLFDTEGAVAIGSTTVDNTSAGDKSLPTSVDILLTVGTSAGNIRSDVVRTYQSQIRRTNGSISDRAILSNARIVVRYV